MTLHRIMATRDSRHAKAGRLGGFVESERNLRDDAWVADEAKVWGGARLWHYSTAYGSAQVFDSCTLLDMTKVGGNSRIQGYGTVIYNMAYIYNGVVRNTDGYIVYQGFREIGALTAYRDTNNVPVVILGGSWHSLPNFIRWAERRYENAPNRLEEARLIAELIRMRFDKK